MNKLLIIIIFVLASITSFSQIFIGGDGKAHSASTGGSVTNLNEVSFSSDTTNFKQGWAKLSGVIYYYDVFWKRLGSNVLVEDFGAKGYPNDDMAAFQRASNYLYSVGGGVLTLGKRKYYLSQYTGAEVNNATCFNFLDDATVSKCWVIPQNVIVDGDFAEVNINGGSSTPYGIISVLAYCGGEQEYNVNSAVNNTSTVYMSNTSGLTVGTLVLLARQGGSTGGVPNTPSAEKSPQQFVTIKSIVTNTSVTFSEGFIQDFQSVSDLLKIYKTTQLADYPKNVFINNVNFTSADTSIANIPYILISRVYNTGLNNVNFSGVAFSFGTSQKIRCGTFSVNAKTNFDGATIESCSDVSIEAFSAEGNGSTNGLGGLFFTDNSRLVKIGRYTASNYAKTGLAMLYSVDAQIDQVTLINCGTSAIADDFPAAMTVGFPAIGAVAPQYARENYVKMRNLGVFRLLIKDLVIKGFPTVPVRAHDIDLTINNAYIEFASTSGLYPFYVGQSGLTRADSVYYPRGGQLNLNIGNLEIKTVSGTKKNFAISALNGSTSFFKAGNTYVNGNFTAGSNTITVQDGTKIKKLDFIKWVSTVYIEGSQVSDVNGNVVTLSTPLAYNVNDKSPVWSVTNINAISGESVSVQKSVIDNAVSPSDNSFSEIYPQFTGGSSPYSNQFNLTVPSEGEWILQVTNLSDDKAHYEQKEYAVTYYDGTNPLAGITETSDIKIRTNSTVNSATIVNNIVTVTVGSYYSGKNCSVTYKWTQTRKIAIGSSSF